MSEIKSLSDYKKQQAIDRLKGWDIKFAVVGVMRIDDDLFPIDASIVSKEGLEEAKKKFVYYEIYELQKIKQ